MSAVQQTLFGDPPAYYDTTHLERAERESATTVALRQEEKVRAIFRLQRKPMSPSAVWRYGIDRNHETWLLTSVRRSISNLTERGVLVKLHDKVDGPYGRGEYQWRLA